MVKKENVIENDLQFSSLGNCVSYDAIHKDEEMRKSDSQLTSSDWVY